LQIFDEGTTESELVPPFNKIRLLLSEIGVDREVVSIEARGLH
jgi:hypothetical protein